MIRRILQRLWGRSRLLLDSRSAYAKWSPHYPPAPHNVLMEIEQEAMLSLIPPLNGLRVLDLACGTGRYGLIAHAQQAASVIGVDDSLHMLSHSSLPQRIQGDMRHIPLAAASIDVVICGMAVGHHPDLGRILQEISRVLAVGGQAIVSDFHPFQYLAGARRTFSQEGQVYEVEHYPHLYETLHNACIHVNLRIDAVLEPTLQGQVIPIVIIYCLVKEGN